MSPSTSSSQSGVSMRTTSLIRRIAPCAAGAIICFVVAGSASAQQRPAARPLPTTPEGVEALTNERREDPRPAPARREGEGPFPKLIIRGTTLIDGTGAPPRGPVDIVIEGNRITD